MTQQVNKFEAIAQRMVNAENAFISVIKEIAGCSNDSAAHVLNVYRKLKLVKFDAVCGTINVKHGLYLDKDIIENAINYQI